MSEPTDQLDDLDMILTSFLTFTLGNEAIKATPEFARREAKQLIQQREDKIAKESAEQFMSALLTDMMASFKPMYSRAEIHEFHQKWQAELEAHLSTHTKPNKEPNGKANS